MQIDSLYLTIIYDIGNDFYFIYSSSYTLSQRHSILNETIIGCNLM